jgi:hypothetical protein
MSRPDLTIAKLAFDCIMTYKPTSILPYKDNITRILADSTIREEMLSFTIKPGDGSSIDLSTRPEVIPLILYTIYGRLNSKIKGSNKKGKDQSTSRKNAVLQFLSPLPPDELRWFLHLMVRGLLPIHINDRMIENFSRVVSQDNIRDTHSSNNFLSRSGTWFEIVEHEILTLTGEDMENIVWEKQVAFLYLMENTIKIVGFNISPYIKHLAALIICLVSNANKWRSSHKVSEVFLDVADRVETEVEDFNDDTDDIEEDTEGISKRIMNQTSKVRTFALLRIAGMTKINQQHKTI